MAAARVDRPACDRLVRLAGAFALAGLAAGCGSFGDPTGYAVVMQDKFDFMTCPEIVGHHAGLVNREKQLVDLVEKAETGVGGFLVGALAYRSELGTVRTQLTVANRAVQAKGCDVKKP
ncbi:MAG: hypothetical protein QOF14_4064 [Hyphomicrobiales bacterium]|nr:hypothetical protein [Hyphomicrobiales bacterium]